MIIHKLLPFVLCLSIVQADAEDENDHDHDHHHGETDHASAEMIREQGFRTEMAEDRIIAGKDVTSIPLEAVFFDGGKQFVLTQSEGDKTKFDRYEVTLGKTDGTYVEAKTGVFPGDNVVVNRRTPSIAHQSKVQLYPVPKSPRQYPDPAWTSPVPQSAAPSYGYRAGRERDYLYPQDQRYEAAPVNPEQREFNRYREYPQPEYRRVVPQYPASEEYYTERQWLEDQRPAQCQHGTWYICPHGNVHQIDLRPDIYIPQNGCAYSQRGHHYGGRCR